MDAYVPPVIAPVAELIAQSSIGARPTLLTPFSFCKDVASGIPDSAWNDFSIFGYGELKDPASITKHRVRLLAAPEHGTVWLQDDNERTPVGSEAINFKEWGTLTYIPTEDFEGKDRAVFLVEANGKQYQVTVNFWVMPNVPDSDKGDSYCKEQKFSGLTYGQGKVIRPNWSFHRTAYGRR